MGSGNFFTVFFLRLHDVRILGREPVFFGLVDTRDVE